MSKGAETRQAILERALDLSSVVGLEGVSIGRLADDMDLSKSGLFAHFGSKEALQIGVLEAASERFVDIVVRPALKAPRGERRVRALFERWLEWSRALAGGWRKHPKAKALLDLAAVSTDDEFRRAVS